MDRREAIEIIRKNWPEGRHRLSEALEFLIPELAESEDEKIRKAIIYTLRDYKGFLSMSGISKEEMIAYLEKQKPVEWSKWDEDILFNIQQDYQDKLNGNSHDSTEQYYINVINWLKSLKPQNRWKPSEEQIQALDTIYKTHCADSSCRKVVFNLLNDLKKLKGE